MPSRKPYDVGAGTATATTTAAALGSATGFEAVLVKADPGNGAVNVLIGNSAIQPFPLQAGESVGLGIDDLGRLYIKTASGTAGVSWIVTR